MGIIIVAEESKTSTTLLSMGLVATTAAIANRWSFEIFSILLLLLLVGGLEISQRLSSLGFILIHCSRSERGCILKVSKGMGRESHLSTWVMDPP